MRGAKLAIALGTVALALPAAAAASDISATRAYLTADHALLRTSVGSWPRVESSIARIDARFAAECPQVGAGSPQDEEAQKFSLEVAGALWTQAYDANAAAVHAFIARVAHLRWSDSALTRDARKLTGGLREMTSLSLPPLCADVHAWTATGYGAAPTDVDAYAKHVEAIEVHQLPPRLLLPYLNGSDRALAAADERLNTRLEELEFVHGQDQWNRLLEVLGLNQ